MDPNANLKEQRRIAERILDNCEQPTDAYRLAELVDALDSWISNGGFLPRDWSK